MQRELAPGATATASMQAVYHPEFVTFHLHTREPALIHGLIEAAAPVAGNVIGCGALLAQLGRSGGRQTVVPFGCRILEPRMLEEDQRQRSAGFCADIFLLKLCGNDYERFYRRVEIQERITGADNHC